MKESITIGIAGAGGDGVVAMGSLLQRIAAARGYFSQMPRYYGAQIRGGGSAVKMGLDVETASLPRDTLDIMVCFNWEKYSEVRHELHISPETLVICEESPPEAQGVPGGFVRVDFAETSQQVSGSTRNKNIVALGLILELLGLDRENIAEVIAMDADLHLLKEQQSTLEAGIELFHRFSFPDSTLSPPRDESPKTIIHGSAAMGRAAIKAGCQAFFGYPITPSAEIMQELQKQLPKVSGVFLQAEDEIASAGLLVGASLTGAKSVTATSGPGLDLMTEMLGLAISAEIPMVIIDVQRCGPSTGIPSKSEQSDLNHAIYGGHGDAPRVVMAPWNVESCYRLTIEAFNTAERYQVPVILLSDQWLGQTFVAVSGDFLAKDYPVMGRTKPAIDISHDYHRYEMTDDFVSPMSDAGDEGLMYRTSGLTHNQDGAPAFDHETHQRLHDKRWKKLLPLCERDDLVHLCGDSKSTMGILTWGSTAQIVRDTLTFMGIQAQVRVCVPELLYPLPEEVKQFAGSVDRLLIIELNYSGQFHRYLRSQIDLPAKTTVYCRAGGRPFSRSELEAPIQELTR